MTQVPQPTAGLRAAAEALELELGRYEQLASNLEHERLDSEKNLRRAAQTLGTISDIGTRLAEHLTALLGAITAARNRQESVAAMIQVHAERIRQRSETLTALLQRWAALGEQAADVNRLAQRLSDEERDPNGQGSPFEEMNSFLTRLADEAESFAKSAETEHFSDLARQGEGLRNQIQSLRNKLRLARQNPSGTG